MRKETAGLGVQRRDAGHVRLVQLEVENGQVVVRPMMYVALSYDHRIIDGRESVGFLVAIKELLEEPSLLLLDI